MTDTTRTHGAVPDPTRPPRRRAGRLIPRIVQMVIVVTAVAVLGAGTATVAGAAQPVAMFHQIGAGEWFRYLTGALEVAGALGLLVPRLTGVAAAALTVLWLCAIATHVFLIGGNAGPATGFLVLSAVVALARRAEIAASFRAASFRATRFRGTWLRAKRFREERR